MIKTCPKCNLKKELNFFYKNKSRVDGHSVYCKECIKIDEKNYKLNNVEHVKNIKNKSAKKHKDYFKKRRKVDPMFKLSGNLRNRTVKILNSKNFKKNAKFKDYLGCTVEELVKHLEKQFKDGMTWENHGQWHIDHIIPLASATNEQEVYKLCHFLNLQPLWSKENMSKGAKLYG